MITRCHRCEQDRCTECTPTTMCYGCHGVEPQVKTCPDCRMAFCLFCSEDYGNCKECLAALCPDCWSLSNHSERAGSCRPCWAAADDEVMRGTGDDVSGKGRPGFDPAGSPHHPLTSSPDHPLPEGFSIYNPGPYKSVPELKQQPWRPDWTRKRKPWNPPWRRSQD